MPLLTLRTGYKWVEGHVKIFNFLGLLDTWKNVVVGVDAEWGDSGKIQTLQLSLCKETDFVPGTDVFAAKTLNYVIDCGCAWNIMET